MNWYKQANEWVGMADGPTKPFIAGENTIRQNMSDQNDSAVSLHGVGLEQKVAPYFGKEVEKCGQEPGSKGGCGFLLNEWAEWHDYGIKINKRIYRSYKCKHCKHSLEPFNINFTKKKKKKHKRTGRKSRLGSNLTERSFVKTATPGNSMNGGGYNNPANTPFGRSDLSEDTRMHKWKGVDGQGGDGNGFEYDTFNQADNSQERTIVIKVKDKNGKIKKRKMKIKFCGPDNYVMPANAYQVKGKYRKQTRYNPSKGDKQHSPGAWPHNRNYGRENWYGQPDGGNNFDGDYRTRVQPWSSYIKERNNFLLTLTKPM